VTTVDRAKLIDAVWERVDAGDVADLGSGVYPTVEDVVTAVLDLMHEDAEHIYRVEGTPSGWGATLKRAYSSARNARAALRHYAPGAKVQRAAVVWEDVQ
jgi:hypothetical protein